MKYAICNEVFGTQPFDKAWPLAYEIGYRGIEIAPFNLMPGASNVDVRNISESRRIEVKQQAVRSGLDVVGLHWLLAKTEGFYLTSPDAEIRKSTIEHLKSLAQLCSDLDGSVMVFGSPAQRNVLPGLTYSAAEHYAAEVFRAVMPVCGDLDVTVALEPLGPAEGNFLQTAESAIRLAKLVESPNCKVHLDVKAMSSDDKPIPQIVHDSRHWTVQFHANDPNLLGPGMGDVDFEPIFAALSETHYDGWVSVEVFQYEPSAEMIARLSFDYMQNASAAVGQRRLAFRRVVIQQVVS